MRPVNIVLSGSFCCRIDLASFAKTARCVKYTPKRFCGAIWKELGTCCLLFGTGRFVLCGVKSMDVADDIASKYSRLLDALGYSTELSTLKVCTVTAVHDFERRLHLDRLHMFFTPSCDYTPELFPALMIRRANKNASVFHSGKVIFTGGKSFDDLIDFWSEITVAIALTHEDY